MVMSSRDVLAVLRRWLSDRLRFDMAASLFEAPAVSDIPSERPVIHCLMALPSAIHPDVPQTFALIDLMEVELWLLGGWVACGVDPEERDAFHRWLERNPNAA
jgi:hypothetical protein